MEVGQSDNSQQRINNSCGVFCGFSACLYHTRAYLRHEIVGDRLCLHTIRKSTLPVVMSSNRANQAFLFLVLMFYKESYRVIYSDLVP